MKITIEIEFLFSPGILFAPRVLYPLDNSYTTRACNEDLSYYEQRLGLGFASVAAAYSDLWQSRLASVVEGAGKRKIFAIGNYLKQRLLFPVHKWAMEVLAKIPMDGTFDQQRPIRQLARLEPEEEEGTLQIRGEDEKERE